MRFIRRVQYQHLLLSRYQMLKRAHKFQKVQIILFTLICQLLMRVQKKSQEAFCTEVLESIFQYKSWLYKCIKLLQTRKYKFSECNTPTSSIILNKLFVSIKCLLRDYENSQKAVTAKGPKHKARLQVIEFLAENIRILKPAIQILKLFMETVGNCHCKQKATKLSSQRVSYMNCVKEKYPQTENGKEETKSIICRQFGGSDLIGLHRSAISTIRVSKTMDEMASDVIDNLFTKCSLRSVDSFTSQASIRNAELDTVWDNLINKKSQLILKASDSKYIKNDLKNYYLRKMQILLKNFSEISKSKKDIVPRKLHPKSNCTKDDVQHETNHNKAYIMHKKFFETELAHLRNTINVDYKVPRIYNIIMSQEIPTNKGDEELLADYKHDTHYYNILMLIMLGEGHDQEDLLTAIERNFENILNLEARKSRHLIMARNSAVQRMSDNTSLINNIRPCMLVMDADFFKVERARWAKYFDEEKIIEKPAKRAQKRLVKKSHQRNVRDITELYTAPRLTHRLRQAINRINEAASQDVSQPRPKLNTRKTCRVCLQNRVCCSKCRISQDNWKSE